MNVQKLIDLLTKVEDKSINVVIEIESGRSFLSCGDVNGKVEDVYDDDDNLINIFVISGMGTSDHDNDDEDEFEE